MNTKHERPDAKRLEKSTQFRTNYRDVPVRLVYFMEHWCYYVYLHESKCTNFSELWLEDKLVKITPESEGWITHEYNEEPLLCNIEMHGGITYYAKHNYLEGYRCVEIGCDYNHLWDQERGYQPDIEEVLNDACNTVDWLYENNYFHSPSE